MLATPITTHASGGNQLDLSRTAKVNADSQPTEVATWNAGDHSQSHTCPPPPQPLTPATATQTPSYKSKRKKPTKTKSRYTCDTTQEHNISTHFPKDPTCQILKSSTTTRAHCKSQTTSPADLTPILIPHKFPEQITADHQILNDDDAARDNEHNALIVEDRYTN